MNQANRRTAVLLPSGRVLITGGSQCSNTSCNERHDIADAELYDPSLGSFANAGDMTCARSGHTATLLPNGAVCFSQTGSMLPARTGHTATLLPNGKVLMVGGSSAESETNELYDPAIGAFAVTASSSGTGSGTRQRCWMTVGCSSPEA